jgi:hypothetical protein
MTNREAHEEAAGMNLDDSFFKYNNIDPDAEYTEVAEGELILPHDVIETTADS